MYVYQGLVAFTEHKKNLRKKYFLFPGGGAPLEGGARWLCHPSFYGSLIPGVSQPPPPLTFWQGHGVAYPKKNVSMGFGPCGPSLQIRLIHLMYGNEVRFDCEN